MKRVILETPYAGEIKLNTAYARLCMHDCLTNFGEAPYASHLLYTQDHVLRDEIPDERSLGILAGFEWRAVAEYSAFYIDLGISSGMRMGMQHCVDNEMEYTQRQLPPDLWNRFLHVCGEMGLQIVSR